MGRKVRHVETGYWSCDCRSFRRRRTIVRSIIVGVLVVEFAGATTMRESRGEDITLKQVLEMASEIVRNKDGTIVGLVLTQEGISEQHVRCLKQLDSIEWLDLAYTDVGDSTCNIVALMRNLRYLNLSHTKVTDKGISTLDQLPSLRTLVLENTAASGAALGDWRDRAKLQKLYITGADVDNNTAKAISQLSNLRVLGIDGPRFDDDGLLQLRTLRRLSRVVVDAKRVSQKGIERFSKAAPNVFVSAWESEPPLEYDKQRGKRRSGNSRR